MKPYFRQLIEDVDQALATLAMQRSTFDQENGTDNSVIQKGHDSLKKLSNSIGVESATTAVPVVKATEQP